MTDMNRRCNRNYVHGRSHSFHDNKPIIATFLHQFLIIKCGVWRHGAITRTSPTSSQVFGPRSFRSSSLGVIIVTDRLSYTVVDCRRSSLSSRRCSCLERTIRLVTSAPFPTSKFSAVARRIPFVLFLTFCIVPVNWRTSLSDTNRFCYLLDYLITYNYAIIL